LFSFHLFVLNHGCTVLKQHILKENNKVEGSTCLTYTGFREGLEHL